MTMRRRRSTVLVLALVCVAGCTASGTLPEGTLPPLGSGPFVPPTTVVPVTTVLPGEVTSTAVGSGTTALNTSGTSWGGWPYYEVPQLGTESVRGTGCGSTGGLGETLPDGVWNVQVGDGTGSDNFWTSSRITLDVRCVYSGIGGQQLWNAACLTDPRSDNCLRQSPDWYVVNTNGRLRTMPVADDVQYGVGALGTSPCAAVTSDRESADAPWRFMDSWIAVDRGRVTAVVSACPAG